MGTEEATEVGARTSMGAVSAVSQPPMREVRLAVVMYGGVSLAVYMNGIAQELLHLVKATAPESRDSDTLLPAGVLTSTEPVYRALSQLIGAEDPGPAANPADPDSLDSRPILARFVIDVISGTSAGGINGVFLAKALANDQDLTTLGKLWIKEGDISVLLNDEGSLSDLKTTNLKLRKPPQSLLNGQRMYLKLLDAFTGMEGNQPAGPQRESRLADELDLYVTTTDLDGLLLPIQLSNRLTWERRYRNVYHFQYTTPVATGIHANDFHQGNNPFLAFAARCTSAFPWAFEPMELQDIWEVMVQFPEYADAGRGGAKGSWPEAWSGFFPDYQFDPITGLGPAPQSIAFRERAFGDGGALDNKPFTYATQTILRHQAELPVDRKLIFVEPDPGYPARSRDKEGRPNALQDFLLQSVLLPREETIRDDLQAVFDRNRVIRRVDRILQDLDEAARESDGSRSSPTLVASRSAQFADRDISDDIRERGRSYAGYHRARVQAVTDDLSELIVRLISLPEEPQYVDAVRYLCAAWRDAEYAMFLAEAQAGVASTNRFLAEFDLGYRIRRLNLLQRRIDRLYRLDGDARRMLAAAGFQFEEAYSQEAFRSELATIKKGLRDVHRSLRAAGREIRRRPRAVAAAGAQDMGLAELVRATGVDYKLLRMILSGPTEVQRRKIATDYHAQHAEAFAALGRSLAAEIEAARQQAATAVAAVLGASPAVPAARMARDYLVYSYNVFEDYDSVAFPMLYASGTEEADLVEVIRMSPQDATTLADPTRPGGPVKVTGAKYMHFGAFLHRIWRERDILWGRLDAAEILISSLLPPDPEHTEQREANVQALLAQAQRVIVAEQIDAKDRAELAGMIAGILAQAPPSSSLPEQTLRELLSQAAGQPMNERMLAVLEAVAKDNDLLVDYVQRTAGDIEPLPPGPTLKTIGRGAHIFGDLLDGVAKAQAMQAVAAPFVWVSRVGSLLSGMVEAATPRSFAHLLSRHWLALLLIFEAFAVAGGIVLTAPTVVQFGLTALLLTALAGVGVWSVSRYIMGTKRWWLVPLLLVAIALAGLMALGVVELAHLGKAHSWIPIFGRVPARLAR